MSGGGDDDLIFRELGTLKGLAEAAVSLRETFGRPSRDLSEFTGFLHDHTRALDFIRAAGGSMAMAKDEAHQMHALLRWLDCGLAAFDLTHGLMAALLLTDPADVGAEAVRLPFETFAVRFPDGFWTLRGHEGESTGAALAIVHTYTAITSLEPGPTPMLSFRIVGRNGRTSTWEARQALPASGPIGDWIADNVPEVEDPSGAVLPPDEEDKRLAVAFRRLLVNLCLYVAARGRGEQLGAPRKPGKRRDTRHRTPAPDVWVLGREVKLEPELVVSAKAWTEARQGRAQGWTLRSRFTVRGHWRHQAHGPGFSLRRLTWIAPYWKGEGPTFAHVYRGPDDGGGQS